MELSFDELAQEMNELIWKQVYNTLYKAKSFWYDEEDIYQEMLLVLWETTKTYDINQGHFSTYLTWQLRARHKNILTLLYAPQRDISTERTMSGYLDGMATTPSVYDVIGTDILLEEFARELDDNNKYILDYVVGKIDYSQLYNSVDIEKSAIYSRIPKLKEQLREYAQWEVA